jgi:hypothetical protein
MITFVAFVVFAMTSATVSFRHQVKKNAPVPAPIVQEDATLKARGIRLPGYNH